jgi:hypothetical protein
VTPIDFPEAIKTLQPSGATYSDNVSGVAPLPVWTDGEQVVSCWRMSWRERLSALFFGRAWVATLSGSTTVPLFTTASRTYFSPPPKDTEP